MTACTLPIQCIERRPPLKTLQQCRTKILLPFSNNKIQRNVFKFTLSLLQNNTQALNLTCNRISKITLARKMRNSLGNSSKLIADYLSECIIEERAIFYLWTLTVTNFSLQCNHWITQGGSWSNFMYKIHASCTSKRKLQTSLLVCMISKKYYSFHKMIKDIHRSHIFPVANHASHWFKKFTNDPLLSVIFTWYISILAFMMPHV